jgi:hypothetical protein
MLFDRTNPFDLPPNLAARGDDIEYGAASRPYLSKTAVLDALEALGGGAIEIRKRLASTDCAVWLDGRPVEAVATQEAAR